MLIQIDIYNLLFGMKFSLNINFNYPTLLIGGFNCILNFTERIGIWQPSYYYKRYIKLLIFYF